MQADILGIATARPKGVFSQEQALAMACNRSTQDSRQSDLLKRMYTNSTIRQRASVLVEDVDNPLESLERYYPVPRDGNGHGPPVSQRMQRYQRDAGSLACQASSLALASAGIEPDTVTQVVAVSCTGFVSPGIDTALIRGLGLLSTTGRTMIGFMGCHGAINGMRVASALATASPEACVLLCAIELCTLHFQYGWHPSRALANGLFADGAASAVIIPTNYSNRASDTWRIHATASCLLPDTETDMGWSIGDHGFEMTLSHRVPDRIREHLQGWLAGWLMEHNLAIGDVAHWVIHPGGPKIIDAVESALGLSPHDTVTSREVLAECGNMSSPTVLFILQRIAKTQAECPCVMLAFGPGLVVEAALLL